MKEKWKKPYIVIPVVSIAAFIMAVNYKTFVATGGLYPGGVSGLTILLTRLFKSAFGINVPFSVVNIALNAIPVYIGFKFIGRNFTLYSCLMILLSSIFTDLIPTYAVTEDILLISVFGGIINGAAICLCLNVGATSGGTDFISVFLSEKSGMDSFNIILGFNAFILCIAGFIFGWDKALYSIIFQYTCTAVMRLLYKKFQQSTLFIVTNKPNEVCAAVYELTTHGATILEGEGSYEHCERNVVYSVVSAAQSKKVIKAVREVDKGAFINEVKTQKLLGNFFQPKED
ncbi:YitT family protein [Ruminococcus sp. FC2018]|uniref:YitT family protein n=1 Tax=Ruminococcus sp. FC2018 TaxID=1410617 RepID=UPI000688E4F8|nr:YitT family protein [Ruminococcus sp. FC2018]